MMRSTDRLRSGIAPVLLCLVLAAMVWAVFGQTLGHEFVNFDDRHYVHGNPAVEQGLTPEGLRMAFTESYVGIWLPLTMLTYQLDYELAGMNPGAFLRTNVVLHTLSTLALFLLLRSMTGSLWESAFVAALFAIHPLRAESVAWISERKDVLSGLFFMLTLGAYTRYARQTSPGRYLLVLLLFALGLLSKPMLVTLPCVLLLLDFWPLNRFETPGAKKLILEKTPFFLLSVVFCAISVWTQRHTATVDAEVTFLWRVANAAVSYAVYIRQTLAPFGLAALYPHPGTALPLREVSASFILLLLITLAVIPSWKKKPWLLTGWLWYLGMLVPVIGIKQVGIHAHADRYTYLPQIGLFIMIAWGAAERSKPWKNRRVILGTMALIILTGLGILARQQVSYWRDGEALWAHALKYTADNRIANYNLAKSLERNGKTESAIEQYRRALITWPNDADALINLGNILAKKGQAGDAAGLYRRALELKPESPEAHTDLGIILSRQGQIEAAMEHYRKALSFDPDYLEAHTNIGIALAKQKKYEAAAEHLDRALEIQPDYAYAHYNLGVTLSKQGKTDGAISHLQKVRELDPDGELAERSQKLLSKLIIKRMITD